MKKLAAVLTALAIFLCVGAFALNRTDYPTWDGSVPKDSLCGNIGGMELALAFDASADYSNLADGMIQACFFAFDAAEQNYLEMYLLLPQKAAPGDVFSPSGSGVSSVSLYEVFKDGEDIYFAGQAGGFAYPQGSHYELRIETVEQNASTLTMSGTLDGVLIRFEADMPTQETLALSGVKFHFTLPLGGATLPKADSTPESTAAPQSTARPEENIPSPVPTKAPAPAQTSIPTKLPQPTLDPHPAFTLPPDYVVL